jgi:hypothetical protein
MNVDEKDKLWDLLGKARQPGVSPFFARNVMRAVRQEPRRSSPLAFFRGVRRWAWQLAVAGTCAAAALVTVIPSAFVHHQRSTPTAAALPSQIVANPDYEVIKHLDELVADEESSVWLDDSAAKPVN